MHSSLYSVTRFYMSGMVFYQECALIGQNNAFPDGVALNCNTPPVPCEFIAVPMHWCHWIYGEAAHQIFVTIPLPWSLWGAEMGAKRLRKVVLSFPFGLLTTFPTLQGASFHGLSGHSHLTLSKEAWPRLFRGWICVHILLAAVRSLIDRPDIFFSIPWNVSCQSLLTVQLVPKRQSVGKCRGWWWWLSVYM